MKTVYLFCLAGLFVASAGIGKTEYQLSTPGKLLLKENFDQQDLPKLFTVGRGDWKIVDGALRGRQLAADNHTAFRKIYLDHYNVIYEYDMKLEGEGFHQLLINWDLVHIAKGVIRYDSAAVFKIKEKNKRDQMKAERRDQGLNPLKGNWTEPTTALDEVPLKLEEGRWYHVVIELVGDSLRMQVDGQTVLGKHIGLTEKKDNFGFQSGGLESYLYVDNVRIREAIPLQELSGK
ncbi:MAG: hypothetical protein O7C75_09390 [Verrucomicrobia bacterium]|nr:hypothetical protein [Verrucomicrobiota bacterium]